MDFIFFFWGQIWMYVLIEDFYNFPEHSWDFWQVDEMQGVSLCNKVLNLVVKICKDICLIWNDD